MSAKSDHLAVTPRSRLQSVQAIAGRVSCQPRWESMIWINQLRSAAVQPRAAQPHR
jgi:hypothetical protein